MTVKALRWKLQETTSPSSLYFKHGKMHLSETALAAWVRVGLHTLIVYPGKLRSPDPKMDST